MIFGKQKRTKSITIDYLIDLCNIEPIKPTSDIVSVETEPANNYEDEEVITDQIEPNDEVQVVSDEPKVKENDEIIWL